jgi:hypothetical protein
MGGQVSLAQRSPNAHGEGARGTSARVVALTPRLPSVRPVAIPRGDGDSEHPAWAAVLATLLGLAALEIGWLTMLYRLVAAL